MEVFTQEGIDPNDAVKYLNGQHLGVDFGQMNTGGQQANEVVEDEESLDGEELPDAQPLPQPLPPTQQLAPSPLQPPLTRPGVSFLSGDRAPPSAAPQQAPTSTSSTISSVPVAPPRSYPSELEPTLHNIVSTVFLGTNLDLPLISRKARNAEYNPRRFAAVIMRIRDPKTTALIFASGKMVCTGAKTEDQSRLAARKYARIIMRLGYENKVKFQDFKVQNIVASCDVRFPIRLEALVNAHQHFCSYEPELFPGLIYRMMKPKVVLLIFVSGKIVLTGAKTREDIFSAFSNIYVVLNGFRKS